MQELKLVKNLTFGDTARSQVLTGVEKIPPRNVTREAVGSPKFCRPNVYI